MRARPLRAASMDGEIKTEAEDQTPATRVTQHHGAARTIVTPDSGFAERHKPVHDLCIVTPFEATA